MNTPWKEEGFQIVDSEGNVVADCMIEDSALSLPEMNAKSRRIVACVNACAGFDTELLELSASGTAPSLREIFTEHSELWKQRDELLAALKEARKWFGDGQYSDELCREFWTTAYAMAVDAADIAIAKAEAV